MKGTKTQTKLLSVFLAFLMVVSLFAIWPTSIFAASPEEHTQSATSISNNFLKINLEEEGRHVLYTTGGNPDISTDNNVRLLYDCTSRTYVKIGSSTYVFSPSSAKTNSDRDSLYSYQVINGVKVERFISFAYNVYTSRYDTVEYKYVLTNTTNSTKSAGTRIFFDTMLGSNDSAPFRVAGQAVQYATTYTGDDIPQTWQVFNDLNNPTIFASGTFYSNVSERPDKVQFLSFGQGTDVAFDCSVSGRIGDSAVNVYFNPQDLAPGESRTVKTYYGLGTFAPLTCSHRDADDDNYCDYCGEPYSDGLDIEPIYSVSLNVTAPQNIIVDEDTNTYIGNPFTLSTWINNNGNQPLTNLKAKLVLSGGLSTDSDAIQPLYQTLGVGSTFSPYWVVDVAPFYEETTLTYRLEISADNMETRVLTGEITVAPLAAPCDHSEGDFVVDVEPTCTEPGVKHFECADCDFELHDLYIPPIGHDYETTIITEVTCTEPGVILHKCANCGDEYYTYIYSEHSYKIVDVYIPDSCEEDGYTLYKCEHCEDEYRDIIPGGHDYEAVVTKVATPDENGEITYTCRKCGHSYIEIIPARPEANVLLVQDRYPWDYNNNVTLLNKMVEDGYITGWDITTTSSFSSVNLANYNVILIANDQSTSTYNKLEALGESLEQFATAGGTVIYGACDWGWAGGDIDYLLPSGVSKIDFYSRYNYIVDNDHFIVKGTLTDCKPLTNTLLYGNYCSHTAFNASTLPDDANIILQDAHGDPTLVEYSFGEGHIILSGLTWEFYYSRNAYDGRSNTTYTKNVYDDLIVYALYMSDPCEHAYDEGVNYDPTCTEQGYTLHTCQLCGGHMKDNFVDALGHLEGEWEIVTEATEFNDGLKVLKCQRCNEELDSEIIPRIGAAIARVECDLDFAFIGEDVVFTLVIENASEAKALAIVPQFDANVFEYVSSEWLLQNATIQYIEPDTYRAAAVWSDFTDINGSVYTVTLRATDLAEYTRVGCTLLINDGEGAVSVVSKSISIIDIVDCPHLETEYVDVDDVYHAEICNRCGYTRTEAHVYDDECDSLCDICDHERIPPHVFGEDFLYDENGHWHICQLCGIEDEHLDHWYDGNYDADCNDCGYVRYIRGDVDNDGDVDSDDTVYLVYNVFFGDNEYPVVQNLDYNGDGLETTDDAIYLLYHIFYGAEDYPLN